MVGVDEVGRGCWAGPLLVVAARANQPLPPGLKDSKLLSKAKRLELFKALVNCCEFGEGYVNASEIDKYGLSRALRLGVKRALGNLNVADFEEIILDGKVNYLPKKYIFGKAIIDADNRYPIVSAASIYAKVSRDRIMSELAIRYPNYSFDQHVGYGTKKHYLALKSFGIIKYVHRFSYKPIAEMAPTKSH